MCRQDSAQQSHSRLGSCTPMYCTARVCMSRHENTESNEHALRLLCTSAGQLLRMANRRPTRIYTSAAPCGCAPRPPHRHPRPMPSCPSTRSSLGGRLGGKALRRHRARQHATCASRVQVLLPRQRAQGVRPDARQGPRRLEQAQPALLVCDGNGLPTS